MNTMERHMGGMMEEQYPVTVADIETYLATCGSAQVRSYSSLDGCLLACVLRWKYPQAQTVLVGGTDYDVDDALCVPVSPEVAARIDQFYFA